MVKKYLNDINELARLPKEIITLHPRGYSGSAVEGGKGKGKTTFCMHTARQVYQYHHGITRDDAWEMVLDNMMFLINDVDEIFSIVEGVDWDNIDMSDWWENRTHLLKIWDDAGIHGGKYKYQVINMCDSLLGNIDSARFVVTGLLINSPELANLLKFLRDYHDHHVIDIKGRYEGGSKWERTAFFQKWQKDKRMVWRLRADPPHTPYSCYIGDNRRLGVTEQWVMDEYEKLKGKALQKNREIKKMIEVAKKCEPDKDPYDAVGIPKEYKEIINS